MHKTLLTTAVALGIGVGVAGAPPSAFAGSRTYSSTSIGISTYGGYSGYRTSIGYRRGDWDDYRGRGRPHYYGHRHYRYHHGHHGTGDALLGAMIGLLAFGVISSATDHNDPTPSYNYAPPAQPPGHGCHTVNRIGPDYTGQTVKFAATMCYDPSGTPFIVRGSQHIIDRY